MRLITALPRIILRTKTPCCGRAVRFRALLDCPREAYERRCPACRTRWRILREIIREGRGIRMDKLEWEKETL